MKRFLVSLVLTSFVLSPMTALAASPSQIIKAEIEKSIMQNIAHAATMTVRIDSKETFFQKGKAAEIGYAEIVMNSENYPTSDNTSDVSMTFDVPVLHGVMSGVEQNYEHPVTLDLRIFNNTLIYVRLTHLAPEIAASISPFVNLDPIMNKWVKIDLQTELKKIDPKNTDLDNPQDQLVARLRAWYLATEKKLGSPLLVTRVQATKHIDTGDKTQVVSVKVNPTWYKAAATFGLDEYKRSHYDATPRELSAKVKEVNGAIKDLRKTIDILQNQVTVNLTNNTVPSFSVNYSKTEPTYSYDYNYIGNKYHSIKKQTGRQAMSVKTAVTFGPVSGSQLVAPTESMSPEDAWKLIEAQRPQILDLPYDSASTSSSTLI